MKNNEPHRDFSATDDRFELKCTALSVYMKNNHTLISVPDYSFINVADAHRRQIKSTD